MNFRGPRRDTDELEINLIPLIDILLVMLIFLAATTSFIRQTQLKIKLPEASSEASAPTAMEIAISHDGRYSVDGVLVDAATPARLAQALRQATAGQADALLVINADAQATHQSVVNVMQAARLAGIARVNFAVQSAP
jgi:biopolymer transport protein ExbD